MGDTTICSGHIVDKRKDGDHCVVDIEMASTNQRGEDTAPGTATVILPSKTSGPITLPSADDPILQRSETVLIKEQGAD
jgi:hypothetical protein